MADFPVNFKIFIIRTILLFTFLHFIKNIEYHIPEMLIFYADKVLVMGHSRNSRFYSKSRRLDANEIFMFYTIISKLAVIHCSIPSSQIYAPQIDSEHRM